MNDLNKRWFKLILILFESQKMSTVENKRLCDQVVKGKVTGINYILLYFIIDKTYRIYIDITRPKPEFPFENDEVELISPKKFNCKTKTAIIGPETTCKFPRVHTSVDAETLQLLNVLKESNIDEEEIIAMDCILRQLEPFMAGNVLLKCLETLLYYAPFDTKGVSESALEYKKSFKKSIVKLPKDLIYVNDNSDLYSFIKFDGMCLYNVYPSHSLQKVTDSVAEYLFGILDVNPTTGYFSLSDQTSAIPVIFCLPSNNLHTLKNSLVMLKKWSVFTEVFEEKEVPSLKYILLNAEDVMAINSLTNNGPERLFYRKNESWDKGQRISKFLIIVKIAEIIYGYSNGPECWIQALISEDDQSFCPKRLVCVILNKNHISIVPFLKENMVYKIFYNVEPHALKIDSYKELKRLKNVNGLYRLSNDTIFQELDKSSSPQNDILLESFEEIQNFIRTSFQNQFFSFSAKIAKKVIRDNNSFASWIPKRHEDVHNFGIPGRNKQMCLVFWNPVDNSYMDLYLSDRDNHRIPLGLIDGMKVKVKHVQAYKNKYMKTSVFSSFEILDYCSEIMFSSVNLFFRERSAWQWRGKTARTLLGMFYHLPQKCIVHGSFLLEAVRYLKIIPVCDMCKKPSITEMPCHICNIMDRDLNIVMSVGAKDSINSMFYMDTENKHFLFELLRLRSALEIKHFSNAFLNIGMLNVNFYDMEDFYVCTKDKESKIFLDELVKTIRSQINYKLFPMVEAVCMRQKEAGTSPWSIIEFCFM